MTDEVKLRIAALRWSHSHDDCTDADDTCPVRDECFRHISVLCDLRTAADLIESLAAENELLNAAIAVTGRIECERDMIEHVLEQVKRERDAAVEDIERAESAAEDMRHLLDTVVHPNCDYGLYISLHDALNDIVAWNHDVSRGTKED